MIVFSDSVVRHEGQTVAIKRGSCDKCGRITEVMVCDGSGGDYYNGEYCLPCIQTFFDMGE